MDMETDASDVPSSIDENSISDELEMISTQEAINVVSVYNKSKLVESIAKCQKPLCEDADFECVMNMVNGTICEAVSIIESDPRGLFCYKYVKNLNIFDVEPTINLTEPADSSPSSDFLLCWQTIDQFEYGNVVAMIRHYIGLWQVSPQTKCVVLSNRRGREVALKGQIYFVDAHFSRPSQTCTNPLAVAKVRFIITVSRILPKHYPVMITYRFEGYRTLYYALGERAVNSNSFQRLYIDTILHSKLSFYAEICVCRHGTVDKPKESDESRKRQKSCSSL
ncbi:uncharacterized protein LOC6568711 [Drosophila grimshawi]|uniref:GH22688 n=1 Tax=Drosophila grimshawi TaxID=7222 RepID=B4JVE7_DROGR|nr:uncharacterized protein LOC6568711 [Drosophila grimshawi]EDV98415.1 GH22688 [Drosophila grimshawi]